MTGDPRLDVIKMPEGYILQAFSTLDSTNQEASRQAEAGAVSGQWIMADVQTAGRGRRGREWLSHEGNLFCTLLLRLPYDLRKTAEMSFVTAVAVRDTVDAVAGAAGHVQCKWPNDVLIKGQKVAGILMESAATSNVPDWVAIGIGINLVSYPTDTPFPATAISAHLPVTPSRDSVMTLLAQFMDDWIVRWQTYGFGVIRDAWLEKAAGLGEQITVRLAKDTLTGRFDGLDEDGALLLHTPTGITKVTTGDIFFSS